MVVVPTPPGEVGGFTPPGSPGELNMAFAEHQVGSAVVTRGRAAKSWDLTRSGNKRGGEEALNTQAMPPMAIISEGALTSEFERGRFGIARLRRPRARAGL